MSIPALAQQPTTGNQPSHIEVNATNTQSSRTSEVIDRFNQAFIRHGGSLLEDLIADDCVMESVEPAPNGTRVVHPSGSIASTSGPHLSLKGGQSLALWTQQTFKEHQRLG